jgi:hypothetical protein
MCCPRIDEAPDDASLLGVPDVQLQRMSNAATSPVVVLLRARRGRDGF